MAKQAKKAMRKRPAVTSTAPKNIKAQPLRITIEAARYLGFEPVFAEGQVTSANRKVTLMTAFNWYNYHFSAKDAHAHIVAYLIINKRKEQSKRFKKSSEHSIENAFGWLARMTMMGWVLSPNEEERLEAAIEQTLAGHVEVAEEDPSIAEEANTIKKFNIQERMREKAAEAAGEIEGMLDDYIADGCKAKHKFVPINVLKAANILPAHVPSEVQHFTTTLAEFKAVYAGKDAELNEAYSHLSKIQLRNVIKFLELIVSDYTSFVAYKKAAQAPRKRKIKTPAELVHKLKYLKEFKELKIQSVNPQKIVGAKEMFVYNTKKRKLQYYVADEHAGGELTVKNNTIIGFDATKSTQKTVRKPEEQIKALMGASRPNTRKLFNNTKSVDIKLNGRFSDDLVILKVF